MSSKQRRPARPAQAQAPQKAIPIPLKAAQRLAQAAAQAKAAEARLGEMISLARDMAGAPDDYVVMATEQGLFFVPPAQPPVEATEAAPAEVTPGGTDAP